MTQPNLGRKQQTNHLYYFWLLLATEYTAYFLCAWLFVKPGIPCFFGMGTCNGHGMEIEEPPYLNEAEFSSRKRHLSGRISPSKESPFHTHSTRLPVLFTFYCSALNKVGFIISCFAEELLPKPK